MNQKDQDIVEDNMKFEIYSDSDDSDIDQNVVSKTIINQIAYEKRRRMKLQNDLESLYLAMEGLKKKLNALPDKTLNDMLEFVTLYHDNRFSSVIYCIDKVLDRIYDTKPDKSKEQSSIKQIHSLHHLLKNLANRDKKSVPWFNYRFFCNYKEYYMKTKQAVDDKAMNPSQISKIEELYPPITFTKNVYAGQNIGQPYSCLDVEILDLTKDNRSYIHSCSNTLSGIIDDYLEIFKISSKKGSALLKERNDMIKQIVLQTQLKFALFSWYSHSDYPITPNQFDFLLSKFKDDLYNKIMEQKKNYLKSVEPVIGSIKVDASTDEVELALTPLEKEKLKQQRIKAMSKYTLVEMVSQAKAEIIVIKDEIERIMMIHAIDIIEKEFAALSSAIDCEVSDISALIHPFQQFASVCFPTVDKNSHLDMVNKVSAVQK